MSRNATNSRAGRSPDSAAIRPTVAMPTATTELSRLLAADPTLCVHRVQPADTASRPVLATLPQTKQSLGNGGLDRPSDLQRVIDAWPRLAPQLQSALMTIIEALIEATD